MPECRSAGLHDCMTVEDLEAGLRKVLRRVFSASASASQRRNHIRRRIRSTARSNFRTNNSRSATGVVIIFNRFELYAAIQFGHGD